MTPAPARAQCSRSMGALRGGADSVSQQYLLPARQIQSLSLAVHLPLVFFVIAFPALGVSASGVRFAPADPSLRTSARRWSQIMPRAIRGRRGDRDDLSFELGLLWPGFNGGLRQRVRARLPPPTKKKKTPPPPPPPQKENPPPPPPPPPPKKDEPLHSRLPPLRRGRSYAIYVYGLDRISPRCTSSRASRRDRRRRGLVLRNRGQRLHEPPDRLRCFATASVDAHPWSRCSATRTLARVSVHMYFRRPTSSRLSSSAAAYAWDSARTARTLRAHGASVGALALLRRSATADHVGDWPPSTSPETAGSSYAGSKAWGRHRAARPSIYSAGPTATRWCKGSRSPTCSRSSRPHWNAKVNSLSSVPAADRRR